MPKNSNHDTEENCRCASRKTELHMHKSKGGLFREWPQALARRCESIFTDLVTHKNNHKQNWKEPIIFNLGMW